MPLSPSCYMVKNNSTKPMLSVKYSPLRAFLPMMREDMSQMRMAMKMGKGNAPIAAKMVEPTKTFFSKR